MIILSILDVLKEREGNWEYCAPMNIFSVICYEGYLGRYLIRTSTLVEAEEYPRVDFDNVDDMIVDDTTRNDENALLAPAVQGIDDDVDLIAVGCARHAMQPGQTELDFILKVMASKDVFSVETNVNVEVMNPNQYGRREEDSHETWKEGGASDPADG